MQLNNNWLTKPMNVEVLVCCTFVLGVVILSLIDANTNLPRLWDFNVYLKAKANLLEAGSPYYDSESLRFIYPPSSLFLLSIVQASDWFKSAYFVLNGALWISLCAFFCRRPIELLIVIPIVLFAFGKHGQIAILTGNIALLLYFVAALSCWLYYTNRISLFIFSAIILSLVLIKPFYAEFLILVWFKRGLGTFIKTSLIVVAAFFAVNLIFYPELFSEFLGSLKVENYDTEIFGITAFSHLSGIGFSTPISAFIHFALIALLFVMFLVRIDKLDERQKFCCLFILAIFINPKHITYDLIAGLSALSVLILTSNWPKQMIGFGLIAVSSFAKFSIGGEPYFQWWYAFILVFALILAGNVSNMSFAQVINLIQTPNRDFGK